MLGAAGAFATELVGVGGSKVHYPSDTDASLGGTPVKLVLTGTALRQKFNFNVYTIGSYVQTGVKVTSAEELAAASCCKRLHLVMERDVSGKDMAEAFRNAIRMNYPEPAFAQEVNTLSELLSSDTARRGDQILLTHLPDVGLHCLMVGKKEFVIKNVAFSRAVWEIYLGQNNLGDAIKKGLVSRL
jgi:hypothetical protein